MKKESLILIFQKKPEEGHVKTRLAKTIGDKKAVEVYQYLLSHTYQQVALLKIPTLVFFEREIQPEYLTNKDFEGTIQSIGNLGDKMKAAFQQAFDQGYRHVLIIGTDCWELRADILEEGLKALNTHEVVIGPAKDGGYYLLGMQKMYRSLFENINWSTSTVFSDTMKEVRNLELEAYVLEVLSDVDTYEDLDNKVKIILDIA